MSVTVQLGSSQARIDPNHPRILAGRDPGACGLALDDPGLSRRHAEVWLENGHTMIRDLGSSSGTWVDGQLVGAYPVALHRGQKVYLGTIPLGVVWDTAAGGGSTEMVRMPDELRRMVELRDQQLTRGQTPAPVPVATPAVMPPAAFVPAAPVAVPGGAGALAPVPASLTYRRQGCNGNGVLVIALAADTFSNAATIDGYVELTALDDETVASISVELVERHRKTPSEGHVWDRVLVRQGPWKTTTGDVLPLPFQLRVPPGTSISGRDVIWEIRGLVDINWAIDIECVVPIHMRNTDIERIRDALGRLDFRIIDLESSPLGQRFTGRFQPPANLRSQWGINDIDLAIEYQGANLQLHMHIDKEGRFTRDRDVEEIYELSRLRSAPIAELSTQIKEQIDRVMQP